MRIEILRNDIDDFCDYLIDGSGTIIPSGMDIPESGWQINDVVGVITPFFDPDNPSEEWCNVNLKIGLEDVFETWATDNEIDYNDVTPSG